MYYFDVFSLVWLQVSARVGAATGGTRTEETGSLRGVPQGETHDRRDCAQDLRRRSEVGEGEKTIDGLVQDCSNSSALAMELLQSYTKPSILKLENIFGGLKSHSTCASERHEC